MMDDDTICYENMPGVLGSAKRAEGLYNSNIYVMYHACSFPMFGRVIHSCFLSFLDSFLSIAP